MSDDCRIPYTSSTVNARGNNAPYGKGWYENWLAKRERAASDPAVEVEVMFPFEGGR